ncbi:UDP-N-acetylmuramoyl-L-alanyl-D-glutamate--2,6-diaminopimelate ligase [Sorangium sp. So ce1153]|uniref:UDP-N-acetylmuramoyl-L-alanyl-D-glutamate--2, 6-diaminopimelate ligase n=1 Tax=Sorangium sp. So ce1153 TaxID=3133333 RepID=UPI003F619C6E
MTERDQTEAAFTEAELALRLGDVLREIPGAALSPAEAADMPVTGVHLDSRKVAEGDIFVARAGARAHGERFIPEAVARGARAVILARGSAADTLGAARVEVPDVPLALAQAAAVVYGHPTFTLEVVGITGTNGKTTTAHLVQACVDRCGGRAGIVGTLGYRFEDLDVPASHTSPEADELARVAAAMVERGATHLVMEVSSIALAAKRADAIRFRIAVFTNLTQDHLDYHGTMEAYAAAKARLFVDLGPGAAVINVDDPFGRQLVEMLAPGGLSRPAAATLARYSTAVGAGPDTAEIAPVELAHSASGIFIRARTPAGEVTVRSHLLGAHNASNLLAALAVAYLLGFDVEDAASALSSPIQIAGRLERCDAPGDDDVIVLVDYAHTPDALARVLASVRALSQGRVLCVFGCGGDRDPLKRPQMGEAVGRAADVAIVTNDNPRSEDPRAIADAILPGLVGGRARVVVELDRARAIERAVLEAEPGDLVLIAGKGHEPYQIIGDVTLPFDDRDEARRALAARRARSMVDQRSHGGAA